MEISEFFDQLYEDHPRYWWHEDSRYAFEADAHPTSLVTQMMLRALAGRPPGRALDLGAGEGSDAIRLALLGYETDAIDISQVAADKIRRFADNQHVSLNVIAADAAAWEPDGCYDVIISNGLLHYINDKSTLIERMQRATVAGGVNVVSLWSTYTPVPPCHDVVPVYCDDEQGIVVKLYDSWKKDLLYFERAKAERAHDDMPGHAHSHIKLIARKP